MPSGRSCQHTSCMTPPPPPIQSKPTQTSVGLAMATLIAPVAGHKGHTRLPLRRQ